MRRATVRIDKDIKDYYSFPGIVTCRLPGLASKFAESIHMEKYVQRHALHDHAWSQHLFTCDVHDRDMDYDLDLDKLREMGLVF